MVQRKLPNKLGIGSSGIQFQADHIRPSSCQHQNGKNKGTDLKRKMKKCRAIKLSDMEGLRSSPLTLRKTISQPHNNSIIKAINGSPNYMKSTSSSEAKKETSRVSSRNTPTGLESDRKSLRCRRTSSTSCNRSATTLRRTSSLKLVRTLTKFPSFKPVRASAKKSSRAALCSDMNVQKATCSSTLKDSKFPTYLMLNPGGTEYQGTSIIKVCQYTYCSLNCHHHTPLPPLKCFLKARRRSMKTQRSMKMEALRPYRPIPSGDATEELDEEPMDFCVDIYANNNGHDVEATRGSTQMNAGGSGCGNETASEPYTDKSASESLSQGSLHSEIDFDENLEHCSEVNSQVDIMETLDEDLEHNDVEEEFRGNVAKEESSPWNLNGGDKQESVSSVDVDHTMFEVIDMEWKQEWPFFASQSGDEAHSSMESDPEIGVSSDESDNSMTDETPTDEAEQVFDEDTCSQTSGTLCYYDQVSSRKEMFEVFVAMDDEKEEDNTEIDLIVSSSTEELYGEPTSGKEEMQENGIHGTVNEVSEAGSLLRFPENSCTIYLKDEGFETTEPFQLQEQEETNGDENEVQKTGGPEADQRIHNVKLLIGIQDSSHVLTGANKDDNGVEDNQSEVKDGINECLSTQVVDESLLAASQDHLSDGHHANKIIVDNQTLEEGEDEELGNMEMGDNSTSGLDLDAATNDESRHNKPRSNSITNEELADKHNNRKCRTGCRRHEENYEESSREFNPREPNFLAVVPESEAEKVDLRHQMMEERKNAAEWMLDHALQQAVTKLAPARKRKVALLVEAFEAVLPLTITHFNHTSTGFAHGRPIQACN